MKWTKTVVMGMALVVGTTGLAVAQEANQGWDRDGDRARSVQWTYQQDRDHDRDRDGDHDRDDGYRNNRGPYYGQGMRQARQNGYQWGLRDAQVDRQANRSYRATTNETYRKATAGYVHAYGDKNQYKAAFRQAYLDGYQRGYGSVRPWGR